MCICRRSPRLVHEKSQTQTSLSGGWIEMILWMLGFGIFGMASPMDNVLDMGPMVILLSCLGRTVIGYRSAALFAKLGSTSLCIT